MIRRSEPCNACGKPTTGRMLLKTNPDTGSFPLCPECSASFELSVQCWIMQDEMKR